MDSSEERINFENMPRILAELRDRIASLEQLITENCTSSDQSPWMDIGELIGFLPAHPSHSTIYEWVREGKIPHYRNGRILYFNRAEINTWLKQKGDDK